jgi:aminopeptidase N
MKRLLLLVICALTFGTAAHSQRLPDNVVPETYDLTFTPDLVKATFSGEESIHVTLRRPAASIVLNSAEIDFQEATITAGGSTQTATVSKNENLEQATLTVPKELSAGPAEIRIRFTGILNDKLRGFYLSETARRRYAVTQFESTDARRAFPSFDEPALKAIFRVTLIIDKGDTAISNGHIISDTPGPGEGKHTLKFSPSPKMSSYLVAMMVGDFQCLEGGVDGIPIRVCAVPEKKELGAFALTAAENIMKYYDRYYYTKWPFEKLDMVAFPDFSAGAMENTAAITYRETALLLDEKTASLDTRENVASVIAHEMAHQWFGDLVTMKWWDDIWLNEGFATWMSWKPMKAWHPEWHNQLDEVQETSGSLSTDSIASIRPIRQKAETPADIEALFDGIAYGKAASVLRAVEAYVGPDVFQKGVNAYLEKHAYGNATAEDFWDQIAATSGKPVDKIMASFIDQPGAPLVTVKSSCSGNVTKVTLSQHRYFADAARLNAPSPEIWQIPVPLRGSASKDATTVLLSGAEQTFDLNGCSEWVYADAGGRGYFRSSYEPGAFDKMSAELETSFSPEERIRFLGDAWAMVRVGRLDISQYLASLEHMRGEQNRAVVATMLGRIGELHDTLVAPAERAAFESWVRDFLRPMAAELGSQPAPGETPERAALRSDVFGTLALYGRDPELIAKSRAIANSYMTDPRSVDEALAGNALAIAASNGDAALYDKFMEHLKTAKTPEEYYSYFGTLGLFPDPALTKRTFDFILSPAVKNQDLYFLSGVFQNYHTQEAAWTIFKADFKPLMEKVDASLGSGLVEVAAVFCDPKLRDDSQQFLTAQRLPGTERLLQNAKDQVNACIELKSLQQSNLTAYLQKQGGGQGKAGASPASVN